MEINPLLVSVVWFCDAINFPAFGGVASVNCFHDSNLSFKLSCIFAKILQSASWPCWFWWALIFYQSKSHAGSISSGDPRDSSDDKEIIYYDLKKAVPSNNEVEDKIKSLNRYRETIPECAVRKLFWLAFIYIYIYI